MFEVKTYRRAIFDGTGDLLKIWRKTDRLKNSDLHFESKMAGLNQHKTSKQIDRPDAARKLYFSFEINE